MKQKIALIIVLFLVLAGLAAFMFYKKPETAVVNNPPPQPGTKNIPGVSLPEDFPKNFPLNPQDAVIRNYTVTKDDGSVEYIRVYQTRLTVTAEASKWNEFIGKEKWTVQNVNFEKELQTVYATKDKNYLSLVIKAQESGGSEVQVRYQ